MKIVLKSSLQKIMEGMSDSELLESVEWCLSSGNNSPAGRRYLTKVLSHNKPVIDAALKELRKRNEETINQNKQLVFSA